MLCWSILLAGGVTLRASRWLNVSDVMRDRAFSQLVDFKIRKCIGMCLPVN